MGVINVLSRRLRGGIGKRGRGLESLDHVDSGLVLERKENERGGVESVCRRAILMVTCVIIVSKGTNEIQYLLFDLHVM